MTSSALYSPTMDDMVDGRWLLGRIRRAIAPMRTHFQWIHELSTMTPDELRALAHATDKDMRAGAARDNRLGPDTLRILANDTELVVLTGVAGNPHTPDDVLVLLAAASDPNIRRTVGENTATTSELLHTLAQDREDGVRAAVAGNTATAASILRGLAQDGEHGIRERLAGNSSTPPDVLVELAQDSWSPHGPTASTVMRQLLHNPNVPVDILEACATSPHVVLRGYAGAHTGTGAQALTTLAYDNAPKVRVEVAGNLSTPGALLVKLASGRDKQVREAALANTSMPVEALDRFIVGRRQTREMIAGNITTRPTTLVGLACDDDLGVRRAVGRNPKTPLDVLMGMPLDIVVKNSALDETFPGTDSRTAAVAIVLAPEWAAGGRNFIELLDAAAGATADNRSYQRMG